MSTLLITILINSRHVVLLFFRQFKFSFSIQIEGVPAKHGIKITANTGVAAANGLYYYLKNVANCSTSWSGDQLHTLPLDSLPMPAKAIEVVIQDK